MTSTTWLDDTLTIGNQEIPVKRGTMPHDELSFYPENPRIYSIIHAGEKSLTQSEIQDRLGDLDHVKQLVNSIRANGGLTDPLIVRDKDFVVLEGNSRLAAYRLLAKPDPITWGTVKVILLPADIEDKLVFALLGEYHIIGRKDWQPYEQAGYLYRMVENHNSSPQSIARELGLKESQVHHMVRVYRFMLEHEDDNVARWSYYDEYIKSRHITTARKSHAKLDGRFVQAVKSGEIPVAVDVRKKMTTIAKGGDRSIKIFLSEESTFDRAHLSAVDRGVDNSLLQQFKRFRSVIAKGEVLQNLESMQPDQLQKSLFELKKIDQRIEQILKKFQ